MSDLITKVFIKQPWLHWSCKKTVHMQDIKCMLIIEFLVLQFSMTMFTFKLIFKYVNVQFKIACFEDLVIC